ncbi:MAG: HAD-IIIA family hydrolase [Acidobacteria bacterium]|nr:HAD-IIIA family hydrolase [Acidobacteriota bacterium]
MMRRAIFLDRDGVINSYVHHADLGIVDTPAHPGEFIFLPGVAEAIARLNRKDLLVIVASNQPGIAKGKFTPELLESMTRRMLADVEAAGGRIDAVYHCLHHPEACVRTYRVECDCRKPKPGLLQQAAGGWGIDLASSYMVGDSMSDIQAGHAVGATTLLVSPRKCYLCDEIAKNGVRPDFLVGNLSEAADVITQLEDGSIRSLPRHGGHWGCGLDGAGYTSQYIGESIEILKRLDRKSIDRTVDLLVRLRERDGRLFFLGVGGGAAHASHAVNDFRKIAGIEAYTPSDNVSELTARVNDEGWDTCYVNWLRGSRLSSTDMLFVFSVGGGDARRGISANIVRALQYAKQIGCTIGGVVGRDGGFTAQVADACVLVPVVNPCNVTPHTESFQALLWHLLVSHPALRASEMKWEATR